MTRSLSVTAYAPDQFAFTETRFASAGPEVVSPRDALRETHPFSCSRKSGIVLSLVLYPTSPDMAKFLRHVDWKLKRSVGMKLRGRPTWLYERKPLQVGATVLGGVKGALGAIVEQGKASAP